MHTRVRRALWMCVVWSLLILVVPAKAAPAYRVCEGTATRNGAWTVLEPPPFEHRGISTLAGQPLRMYRYALDPFDRRVAFISNNETLKRSNDGGCTWEEVFALDATLTTTAPGAYCGQDHRVVSLSWNCTITSIDVVRESRATQGRVYLQVSSVPTRPDPLRVDPSYPSQRNHGYALSWIFVSDDGGKTWELLNQPTTGFETRVGHGDLVVHPTDPLVLYLVRHASADGEVPGQLLKSTDGGATWSVAGPVPAVTELAVNPHDPNDLWAFSPALGAFHSVDGGAAWEQVDVPAAPMTDMAVSFTPSSASVALADDQRHVHVSLDAGKTWASYELGTHLFPLGDPLLSPLPRLPVVGYSTWAQDRSVQIDFGAGERDLFVAAISQGWVGRMDAATGAMALVKGPLNDQEIRAPRYHYDDLQARLKHVQGVGLSLFQGCETNFTCTRIGIYRGRGA